MEPTPPEHIHSSFCLLTTFNTYMLRRNDPVFLDLVPDLALTDPKFTRSPGLDTAVPAHGVFDDLFLG